MKGYLGLSCSLVLMVSSHIGSWLCSTMSVLCKEIIFIIYYVSVGNNYVFLIYFFYLIANGSEHLEFTTTRVSRDDYPMGAIFNIGSFAINL